MSLAATSKLEQRDLALRKANAIRSRRAELKREIKAGNTAFLVAALRNPPEWLHSAPIYNLLLCVPRVGHSRVRLVMRSTDVLFGRRVGELTLRQRVALARVVDEMSRV